MKKFYLIVSVFISWFFSGRANSDEPELENRDREVRRLEVSIPARIEYEEGLLRLTFDDDFGVVVCDVQDCASGDSWESLFDSRFEGQLYLGKEDGVYTISIETEDGVIFHETCEIIKNRSL